MKNIQISSGQITFACVLIAVIGVVMLYFYSLALQPNDAKISEILVIPVGKYVRISGVVESIELDVSFSKIAVCDPLDSSCISVRFSNDLVKLNLYDISEGDMLTIKGIVKEYYNKKYLEIKSEDGIVKVA